MRSEKDGIGLLAKLELIYNEGDNYFIVRMRLSVYAGYDCLLSEQR